MKVMLENAYKFVMFWAFRAVGRGGSDASKSFGVLVTFALLSSGVRAVGGGGWRSFCDALAPCF